MFSKHQIEQEIKLTAPDEATLDRLMKSPIVLQATRDTDAGQPSQHFAAIYYDTPDWVLRDMRWSLRTRYEGELHMSTLKRNPVIKHGYSYCEEIEQATTREFERVACVPAGEIADALGAVIPVSTPLLKRVKVSMQRHKRMLEIGNNTLELVTDSGIISANGQVTELHEVELEILQGDLHDHDVNLFSRQLVSAFALTPSRVSKHQIGLAHY